jgi:hypothetical protein
MKVVIQQAHIFMVSVANDNIAAALDQLIGYLRKLNLIAPSEEFAIVLNKAIVIVANGIGWITVNKVAFSRVCDHVPKVPAGYCSRFLEHETCGVYVIQFENAQVALFTVWYIEYPFVIFAIDAIERQAHKIVKAGRSCVRLSWFRIANAIIVVAAVSVTAQRLDQGTGIVSYSCIEIYEAGI